MLKKGDKKLINAWAFYDWANSVYSLVISTAVFPIYYSSLTESFSNIEGKINFLGTRWDPTTLYDYTLAFSFLIVAFLSPILSGIADYTGNKLKFLKAFCLLGSLSVMSLFFFKGEETLWVGIVFTILASIGFWGSIVFYNAYLPEVAHPEQQDNVSAKGFILGYVGSIILLLLSLIMINKPELFGIPDAAMASRITFLIVGVWWFGFAQITYSKLPNNIYNRKPEKDFIWKGLHELKIVALELRNHPELKFFLSSFFMYSVGVQTIILMAGIFGSKELGLPTLDLIAVILIVQVVGIVGAFLFSRLSDRIGNISSLKITVIIWSIICVSAFMLDKSQENVHYYFYSIGALIGLVMGAIQSLSRSTYSKLLPETKDHATYFSFYDVTEKLAIVFGMIVFGLLVSLTGSMQWSVLFLAIFFLISFVLLTFVGKTKYVQ
ncbi:MFS transporter [Lutibacter maritimus]|uniref:MFS transporter, UMF1 family n=1 Tax=Lutibacter maritimus TaxID=593133 RepID=A0A1I6SLG8_9FLAO|nr:MFS transporter [Lutibacter maritimus]SFS77710.1 MFS transporter, UMF1 family [Lutibacter maritimus]